MVCVCSCHILDEYNIIHNSCDKKVTLNYFILDRFLVACKRFYKKVCPLVRWSVCRSDRRSVPLTKCGGVTDDGNPNPERKGSGSVGGGSVGGVGGGLRGVLAVQYSTLT